MPFFTRHSTKLCIIFFVSSFCITAELLANDTSSEPKKRCVSGSPAAKSSYCKKEHEKLSARALLEKIKAVVKEVDESTSTPVTAISNGSIYNKT